MKFRQIMKHIFSLGERDTRFSLGERSKQYPKSKEKENTEKLQKNLAKNKSNLEEIFGLPDNKDIVIREFKITALNKNALIIYIDGLTDRNTQNFAILQPLMLLASEKIEHSLELADFISQKLIPDQQITKTEIVDDVVSAILDGSTVLLFDNSTQALITETKGWEHRGIEKPASEYVVRGPQESFNESFRANTASVRRYLKDPKLITEIFSIGRRSRTTLGLMYLKDVANPQLLEEVRYRLNSISDATDFISETGTLEEYLEDHPLSIIPQLLSTERPDRLAAQIREGFVGIVMANSPFSLIIPATYTMFIHASEDYYLRWPFGNFLRFIRAASLFTALFLPAIYISLVNFHQEMIPTHLLLAMTSARENVPFPAVVEIILMEFAFELIREAGIRVPSVIGPTIGIVGALVLGQAAVAASIVSPILIIVIAITALSSFVIPNYNASFSVRILRFFFLFLAAFLGFFGLALGIFLLSLHLVNLSSFGVPFLTPLAPSRSKAQDQIIRPFAFNQRFRPTFLKPLDLIRQQANSRPWKNKKSPQGGNKDQDE